MNNKFIDIDQIIDERQALEYLSNKAINLKSGNERLYHYTTFESVMKIIQDHTFRLTRTDLLNDKAEMKIGNKEKAIHHYIMSMTEAKEYISMWAMYGRPSGIKLRLDFSKLELLKIINQSNQSSIYSNDYYSRVEVDKDGIIQCSPNKIHNLFGIDMLYPIRFAHVAYINKEKNKLRCNNRPFRSFKVDEKSIDDLTGFSKYDAWEFEKEIRLLVHLDNNEPTHIYLPITDDLINSFSITFNPWISEEMKEVIKQELNQLAGTKLSYRNSSNNGEVDENRI